MTKIKNDGGPAFPIPEQQFSDGVSIASTQGRHGMSLRDYFAARALASVYDHYKHAGKTNIAEYCYQIADAMIAAGEIKP